MNSPGNLTYGTYLRLDDLLSCQSPLSDVHDEMLFVIIHQVYELWFKQTLYETDWLQRRLESGDGAGALAAARRIAKIFKTVVGQMDVLETMTPQQFSRFRPDLGRSSGFQSYQFRRMEAAYGRRYFGRTGDDPVLDEIMVRRPVFESLLPFPDGAFDAAMTTFSVHQWGYLRAGLREVRRVTRGPVVILTCDRGGCGGSG